MVWPVSSATSWMPRRIRVSGRPAASGSWQLSAMAPETTPISLDRLERGIRAADEGT